jgi:thioredoxin 1
MSVAFSDSNFEQEVLKSEQPVIVDFWAEWCMPCQMVGPVIEELAKEYEGKVKIGKMNVDENGQTPSSFGIMSIPTVMVFKNGTPQRTLIGVQSKDTYKQVIEEVL